MKNTQRTEQEEEESEPSVQAQKCATQILSTVNTSFPG
jgi:hypothetical protein